MCIGTGGTALDFFVAATLKRLQAASDHPGGADTDGPKSESESWLERDERERTARVRAKIRAQMGAKARPTPKTEVTKAVPACERLCRSIRRCNP